jgi:hypothetical protein
MRRELMLTTFLLIAPIFILLTTTQTYPLGRALGAIDQRFGAAYAPAARPCPGRGQ